MSSFGSGSESYSGSGSSNYPSVNSSSGYYSNYGYSSNYGTATQTASPRYGSGYYGNGYMEEPPPPTFRRIACIRYVRPMIAYDRCGCPYVPPTHGGFNFPNLLDPYANGCAGQFPPSNRVLICPPRSRNLYRPARGSRFYDGPGPSGPPSSSYYYKYYDDTYTTGGSGGTKSVSTSTDASYYDSGSTEYSSSTPKNPKPILRK